MTHEPDTMPSDQQPSCVPIMGVPIHRLTQDAFIDHMFTSLANGVGGWVITVNLDILRRCVRDREFAELAQQATLRVADGMPLVWGSRLKGTPLPERIAGSSLMRPICEEAGRRRKSIFLLGGAPGTAEAAAHFVCEATPELIVAGTHCPPLGFEQRPEDMDAIVSALRRAQPDIVFVALGSPKQERLVAQLKHELPNAWWLGVGISFSFLAGEVRRAPIWMQRMGLEWFHRLIQEPRRLARRYLVDGLPFAIRLFVRSVRERAQAPSETLQPPSA